MTSKSNRVRLCMQIRAKATWKVSKKRDLRVIFVLGEKSSRKKTRSVSPVHVIHANSRALNLSFCTFQFGSQSEQRPAAVRSGKYVVQAPKRELNVWIESSAKNKLFSNKQKISEIPMPSSSCEGTFTTRHKIQQFPLSLSLSLAMRFECVLRNKNRRWLKEKRMKERNTWSAKNVARSVCLLVRWSICNWKFSEVFERAESCKRIELAREIRSRREGMCRVLRGKKTLKMPLLI